MRPLGVLGGGLGRCGCVVHGMRSCAAGYLVSVVPSLSSSVRLPRFCRSRAMPLLVMPPPLAAPPLPRMPPSAALPFRSGVSRLAPGSPGLQALWARLSGPCPTPWHMWLATGALTSACKRLTSLRSQHILAICNRYEFCRTGYPLITASCHSSQQLTHGRHFPLGPKLDNKVPLGTGLGKLW